MMHASPPYSPRSARLQGHFFTADRLITVNVVPDSDQKIMAAKDDAKISHLYPDAIFPVKKYLRDHAMRRFTVTRWNNQVVAYERDIRAYRYRSAHYESGYRGYLHHRIANRTADLAQNYYPASQRILDVGCGTGYLLRRLMENCAGSVKLSGIDPVHEMIKIARSSVTENIPIFFFVSLDVNMVLYC